MEEVRYGRGLRERMRRVDLDAITFAFGSWEVEESQYFNLERAAGSSSESSSATPTRCS